VPWDHHKTGYFVRPSARLTPPPACGCRIRALVLPVGNFDGSPVIYPAGLSAEGLENNLPLPPLPRSLVGKMTRDARGNIRLPWSPRAPAETGKGSHPSPPLALRVDLIGSISPSIAAASLRARVKASSREGSAYYRAIYYRGRLIIKVRYTRRVL